MGGLRPIRGSRGGPAEELPRLTLCAREVAGCGAAGATVLIRTATDIAEDFNLGGRGHRASPEEAGGPSAAGKVKNRMS